MSRHGLVFALALFFGMLLAANPARAGDAVRRHETSTPTVSLTLGQYTVTAEIADTEALREKGLMNRFSLPENRGMLFVYPRPERLGFWMKDTRMPLSIAFIARDGRILNIREMMPLALDIHLSEGPGMYALEMPGKWFERHGISSGMKVLGLDKLRPARE